MVKHNFEATNVFYYLTYEGKVDLNSIPDPVQKQACIGPDLNLKTADISYH